jgi:O-antigen/teichoic acid export membrane protein
VIEERSSKTLREHTLSGVKWMSLTRVVAESTAFVSIVVLARLIPPDEFGRTAVAVFVSALALAVAQLGVGSFLVSHDAPNSRHFRAASFVALSAGVGGSAVTLAFALTVAPAIFGPRTAHFVALASPVWILACVTAVPIATLQRALSFGRLSIVQASASVVSPIVAIVLALSGLDGEALIIGALAGYAAMAVCAVAFARPARPGWHPGAMRDIVGYGGPVSGSSILYTAVRNVDYVLLAAFIPAFQVGLYMRAFALGWDYQAKISQILVTVAFPVFSRATDMDEIRRLRARMMRVHATFLFPLLFGLIAVAPTFVPWMYGDDWAGAASLTQILAVGGMLAAVGTGTGPLLMATGHPLALLVYNLIALVAYVLAVLAAIPFGLTAVCVAVVAVRLITFVSLQRAIVEPRVGIPILATARDDAIPALVGGVPQLAVTILGLRACLDAELPVLVAMALPGAAGLVVYALIMRTFFPAAWSDVRMLTGRLGSLKRRRRGPAVQGP